MSTLQTKSKTANLNLSSLCLGDQIVHCLYYITIKMTAQENQMIIALIINVKITLLYFLTSLIIIFNYKVKIQVKDHIATTSFVLFEKDAEKIIQKTFLLYHFLTTSNSMLKPNISIILTNFGFYIILCRIKSQIKYLKKFKTFLANPIHSK